MNSPSKAKKVANKFAKMPCMVQPHKKAIWILIIMIRTSFFLNPQKFNFTKLMTMQETQIQAVV